MSRYAGNGERCPICGLTYGRFRTGLTFAEVRSWLWVGSDDPRDWKPKRRGSVLGLWHETKKMLWAEHIRGCDPENRS